MIRARTLFPLRNGPVTVAAKPTADARAVLSSRRVSRTARGSLPRLPRSPRPIWPCSWDQKRCSPSRATVSYFIPHLAWSLPQRVAPGTSEHDRTDAGQSPDAHRMPLARRQRLRCASCVTFDGSTRLRTERPARSSLAPRRPGSRLFSTSIPTDT